MTEEEMIWALSDALEQLEIVDTVADDDYLLLRNAVESIRKVRDELRHGGF